MDAHAKPLTPTPEITLVERARVHADRLAVVGPEGVFTYQDLLAASDLVAERLSLLVFAPRTPDEAAGIRGGDLAEARIGYLVPPGFEHVAVQWGIWRGGGVAVPLATSHPAAELTHVLDDCEASALVVHPSLVDRVFAIADERGIPVLDSSEICSALSNDSALAIRTTRPTIAENRRALIIYTSGTTGRAKGVVTTHANLQAQVESLVEAWGWSEQDHVLLVLPLHHVHGIVNVVTCALWSGACCQMSPRFDATATWDRFAQGDLTLFMAVPTVFVRLIQAWEEADQEDRERWARGARAMRLMVSGSAALPISVLKRWEQITGMRLLERYGMTEVGMALSNPLEGERRAGQVGRPLPGVQIRRVDESGEEVRPEVPGEVQDRGTGVFSEYWRRPEETSAAFNDGWFRTGDVAVVEDGYYRLLGRMSVDIIKTSGYKVSALEIEEKLREHPAVDDCAVVGVPDLELGEKVCGVVVAAGDSTLDVDSLLAWAKSQLAPYKVPGALRIAQELPRNSMEKVQKRVVRDLFATEGDG